MCECARETRPELGIVIPRLVWEFYSMRRSRWPPEPILLFDFLFKIAYVGIISAFAS